MVPNRILIANMFLCSEWFDCSLSIKFFFCKANIVIFVSIKDFLYAILAIHSKHKYQFRSFLYHYICNIDIVISMIKYWIRLHEDKFKFIFQQEKYFDNIKELSNRSTLE
jgi:hypothetical protein